MVKRLQVLSDNHDLMERIVAEAQAQSSQDLPLKRGDRQRIAMELGKLEQQAKSLVMVLAEEGPNSPMKSYIRDQLGEIEAKKQEFASKVAALDIEIERLEKRQIDAAIIRRNLGNFLKLFEKMTGKERQEFMALLIGRVIYDGLNGRVRIALRPLPDAWGDLDYLEGCFGYRQTSLPDSNANRNMDEESRFSYRKTRLPATDSKQTAEGSKFDYCQKSLPASNSKQTIFDQIMRLNEEFDFDASKSTLLFRHNAAFGMVNVTKGQRLILPPNEAVAIRSRQRRYKPPPEPQRPTIQILLERAYSYKEILESNPGMTRSVLAKQLGVNPSYLSRILNLLNLAPEIQMYIRALPQTAGRVNLSESRLKSVARMPDHQVQLQQFKKLRKQEISVPSSS